MRSWRNGSMADWLCLIVIGPRKSYSKSSPKVEPVAPSTVLGSAVIDCAGGGAASSILLIDLGIALGAISWLATNSLASGAGAPDALPLTPPAAPAVSTLPP